MTNTEDYIRQDIYPFHAYMSDFNVHNQESDYEKGKEVDPLQV